MAEEAAEKIHKRTSEAKAGPENKAFNAALEALLHPKPEFFRSLCRALPNHFGFSARLEAAPFQSSSWAMRSNCAQKTAGFARRTAEGGCPHMGTTS
jgi:hypothetical protein